MKNYPGVKEIRVTGLSTDEIKNWCKKHGFKLINDGWDGVQIID